jgi:putative SOS response-associated peptidase YedK
VLVARERRGQEERELVQLQWGFVPSWSKDPTSGQRPINVRSETVTDRPMFRSAFRQRRCLIAADGFYEWKAQGRGKQPFYFQLSGGGPFGFAGVWETWKRDDKSLETCALFTTSPNSIVAQVHDRMPVILEPENFAEWLDPSNDDTAGLAKLMRPLPADQMTAQPVSTRVNSPRHDDSECIVPIEDQGKLFD